MKNSPTKFLMVICFLMLSKLFTIDVSACDNVLTPGVIGSDQSNCGPFKPATLTALTDATANPGKTITYQWLYSYVNVPNTYGNPYWHAIPGATSSSYSPDSVYQTTYFIRCARTLECTFVGNTTESNVVEIFIHTNVLTPGTIGSDQTHCGPFKPATLTSISDATADAGESITYQWLYSHVNVPNTVGNPYWHAIPGANSPNYSPDSIFQTTYYIRCARTLYCTFVGNTTEGNIVTVTIKTCCTAEAEAGSDFALDCDKTHETLNGSTTTANPVVTWTTTNGHIVSGANTLTPEINLAGTYVLTVYDQNQCSITDTVVVTGHTNVLTPGVIGSDQSHCGPFKPATLTALTDATANPGETITYQWLYSLVNVPNTYGNPYWHAIPGANSSGYSPDSIFVTTYFIRCAKTAGCTFVGNTTEGNIVTILINPPVHVKLGNDTILCAQGCVKLDAGNQGMTYSWSTGATTQSITTCTSGNYSVTVSNQYNCSASDEVQVTVLPAIKVDLGKDTTLCADACITLNAGNKGMMYSWSTGATTQTITACASGSYSVVVSNENGCTGVGVINIIVLPKIKVHLGNDTTICAKACVTLDAGNQGMMYSWSTGASSQTISACATGSYSVVVWNQNGCRGSDVIHVTVLPEIKVNLGNDTILCAGSCVTLNAGIPGMMYSWSTGATTQTINVCTSGTFTVTVKNQNGCSGSDVIKVTVSPVVHVNLGKDTTITSCNGILILDAMNIGSTYLWNSGMTTQTLTVTKSGVYAVVVTNNLGCTASDTIKVTITKPGVDLGHDTTLCSCIVLNATTGSGATYQWCSGQQYPTINVCKTGMYCVEVRNGNCISKDTILVTILPPPVVNLGHDTTLVGSLTLDAGNVGAMYMWNTGATTEKITVTTSGKYYVTITAPSGCKASDTINVVVMVGIAENFAANYPVTIYPNPSIDKTFTMNFQVPEKGSVEIKIFNQLGLVVYYEKVENFKGTYQKNIRLEHLAEGIYFGEVLRDNNRSVMKIKLD